jgi:hypothetical protein
MHNNIKSMNDFRVTQATKGGLEHMKKKKTVPVLEGVP